MPRNRHKIQDELTAVEVLQKTPIQVWLVPVGVVVGVVATFFILVIPQINGFFELRDEIEKSEETLEQLSSKRVALEQLSEADLERNLSLVNNVLPQRTPLMEALVAFYYYAEENEVEISDYGLKPGELATESAQVEERARSGVKSMDLELRVRGEFDQVISYVASLQEMAPILHLDEIGISISHVDEQGNQLPDDAPRRVNATIDVAIHYADSPKMTSSATTPLPQLSASQEQALVRASSLQEVDAGDLWEAVLPEGFEGRQDFFRF